MKRIVALLTALALLGVCLAAYADEPGRVRVTASYLDFGPVDPSDAVNRLITDRFQLDIQMVALPYSGHVNEINLMANGGTLLDWMTSEFNYDYYLSWARGGLVKPMPLGWEEAYPNIYAAAVASGILDKLYVDGRVYCLPEVVYFNYVSSHVALNHTGVFYRADWLRALGMEPFGDTVTISQLTEFCRRAVEADLAGDGRTLGLTSAGGTIVSQIMQLFDSRYAEFARRDGQYVWIPSTAPVPEGIRYLKELYQAGVINPDFYLETNSTEARFDFTSGRAAAYLGTQNPSNVLDFVLSSAAEAGIDEGVDMAVLTDDSGKWCGTQSDNFWQVNLFRPNLDDNTFSRLLALMDWMYTQEFEEIENMGLEGVDWTRDGEGRYVILSQYDSIRSLYPSITFWYCRAIAEDEFGLVSPSSDPAVLSRINAMYEARARSAERFGYEPLDMDYAYYDSDTKSRYAVDVNQEILRIVVDERIAPEDVAEAWSEVVEAARGQWEPLTEELNQAFPTP